MTVGAYCITMELGDRHFLALAVTDPAGINADTRAAIAEEPKQVAYRCMVEHRRDGESAGQFTPWLDVRRLVER